MSFAIRVDNLGKRYRLGLTHAGSIRELVNRTWKRLLGRKESPLPHEHAEMQALAERQLDGDGTFWALRDVSFEVQPGEVVGIIGRNGSGKSTLLKILSQITAPTTGRVELHGRVASLLEVGTGFHPELSGRENVFLNGAILGMTKREIRRKFDEIVAFAEIEQFIDTPVKRYSSGMYVRLAFAVAAHLEPEILIVDEVLAVGDVTFQKKCLSKMGEVAHIGRTVLLVSHNMQAVLSLAGKCIALNDGRVSALGESEEVVRTYQQRIGTTLSGGSRDLGTMRRGGGDGAVRVLRVQLQDKNGTCRDSFSFGEPISVTIDFASRIASDEFEIGLGVATLEGTMLFVSSSSDTGKLLRIEPGIYQITLKLIPNCLKPRHYWIAIGITCGILRDYIAEALQFEINTANLVTRSPLIHLPGIFQFNYHWEEIVRST